MLVLTRRKDQEIIITVPPSTGPTQIVVKVADVLGSKVRVGFSAPDGVAINRAEVQEAIDRGEGR